MDDYLEKRSRGCGVSRYQRLFGVLTIGGCLFAALDGCFGSSFRMWTNGCAAKMRVMTKKPLRCSMQVKSERK